MNTLTIEKNSFDRQRTFTLRNSVPVLVRDETTDSKDILLKFNAVGDNFVVVLTPLDLQMLGLQCLTLMPSIVQQYSASSPADLARLMAKPLRNLEDRGIQILLRECQSDTLIDFLWYMKDAGLIEHVMNNMSSRAAEMLMEDLVCRWEDINPDTTNETNVNKGISAVREIVAIFNRLVAEGQIVNPLGEVA